MLVLSHPCLKCWRVAQSEQRCSSVPSFAYPGSTGNTKLGLFPLNEDSEEKASPWSQHLCKLCQGQVKFGRGGSNITYIFYIRLYFRKEIVLTVCVIRYLYISGQICISKNLKPNSFRFGLLAVKTRRKSPRCIEEKTFLSGGLN